MNIIEKKKTFPTSKVFTSHIRAEIVCINKHPSTLTLTAFPSPLSTLEEAEVNGNGKCGNCAPYTAYGKMQNNTLDGFLLTLISF